MKSQYTKLSSLFMLLILLTLFASLSFANDVTVTITTTDGGTFNVEQDGEDNNIDYDIESMDEFVINLDQTGNDNNIWLVTSGGVIIADKIRIITRECFLYFFINDSEAHN